MHRYASCLALVLSSGTAFAGSPESFDWPQWQGPDRTAASKERGLLQEWAKDGPPLAWKANGIGEGMGGIAVSGRRIYTTGDRDGSAWLFALDESDGKAERTPGRRSVAEAQTRKWEQIEPEEIH